MTATCTLDSAQATRVRSGELHLDDFCGQKLVVLFCPSDATAAEAELSAFQKRAEEFEREGAWLVAVSKSTGASSPSGDSHIHLVVDPDGLAFQTLAAGFPADVTDTNGSIVFLVDRDGVARHVWTGPGRAEDVLSGVRERP